MCAVMLCVRKVPGCVTGYVRITAPSSLVPNVLCSVKTILAAPDVA